MDRKVVKLLLVDDDAELQESLIEHLSGDGGLEIVHAVANGFQALQILKQRDVDVVVSDIRMPGMDGIELFQRLKNLPNCPRFVAMTAHDTDEAMLELLRNGANGYIIKGDSAREIRRSVYAAAQGGTSVSPIAMTRLLRRISNATERPTAPDTSRLTPIEAWVLNLICLGQSNKRISEETGMSISSVKKQVSGLLQHFGVSSRSELIVVMHR